MKLNKKYQVLLSVMVLAVLAITCRSYAAEEDALTKIIQKGEVTVGIQLASEPLCFLNTKTGQIDGMLPELARSYAEKLGVKIKFMEFDWPGLFPALLTKKVDFLPANITTTIPRTEKLNFTRPWIIQGASILVRRDTGVKTLADVNSEKIKMAVSTGSVYIEKLAKTHPKTVINRYQSHMDRLSALLANRSNATIDDELNIINIYYKGNEKVLEIIPEFYLTQSSRWATRQEDVLLNKSLNIFFDEIRTHGEYKQIYEKWLKKEWKPKIVGF